MNDLVRANPDELFDFMRQSWLRDESETSVAALIGCNRQDVCAFNACLEAGTASRLRGADLIVRAIVGLRDDQ